VHLDSPTGALLGRASRFGPPRSGPMPCTCPAPTVDYMTSISVSDLRVGDGFMFGVSRDVRGGAEVASATAFFTSARSLPPRRGQLLQREEVGHIVHRRGSLCR